MIQKMSILLDAAAELGNTAVINANTSHIEIHGKTKGGEIFILRLDTAEADDDRD